MVGSASDPLLDLSTPAGVGLPFIKLGLGTNRDNQIYVGNQRELSEWGLEPTGIIKYMLRSNGDYQIGAWN